MRKKSPFQALEISPVSLLLSHRQQWAATEQPGVIPLFWRRVETSVPKWPQKQPQSIKNFLGEHPSMLPLPPPPPRLACLWSYACILACIHPCNPPFWNPGYGPAKGMQLSCPKYGWNNLNLSTVIYNYTGLVIILKYFETVWVSSHCTCANTLLQWDVKVGLETAWFPH